MRSRFLALVATLVGIVAALLGIHAAATAAPVPNGAAGHVYDGQHRSAALMHAVTERGPATMFDNGIADDPGGLRPHGARALLSGPTSATTYDYTEGARLAQIAARNKVARQELASGLSGKRAVVQRLGVAANAGRVAGPARSTDLVLDSFRGLGPGRNAHVRTVGSVDELHDTFNAWTVGAERLAARGPKVPDVYRLPDGGTIQWRTTSATGGPSIDIFPVSGRQRTVHLADGVPW